MMKHYYTILLLVVGIITYAQSANAFSFSGSDRNRTQSAGMLSNDDIPRLSIGNSGEVSLGLVTGSPTGTYFRFGHDIKKSLQKENINIQVKPSKGSITNIKRIGSNENAAFGIVQSDVLGFLNRSKQPESRKLANNLRMIFPFYQEEVHIIANQSVQKFSDLDQKNIVVGPSGSGSWLTAMNMFSITGIRPAKLRRLVPEEGLRAVLTGEADAMIFVAGKPVTLFETLGELSDNPKYADIVKNVHFVPITTPALVKEYAPSVITADDYEIVTHPVPTVAVTAVLISYDFSESDSNYARSRCDDIRRFTTALTNQIDELKQTGHKKWQEVDLDSEVGIWKRDKCASTASASIELENELLNELEMKW